jgi:hypothetical protein
MENTKKIASLRRRRGFQIGQLTFISKRLDEYEKSNQHCVGTLTGYNILLDKAWNRFQSLQDELNELVEEEDPRDSETSIVYSDLTVRLQRLMKDKPASSSKTSNRDSSNVAEPTSIKLPELHLPIFDGTIEHWHSFYDSFSSTIDRSEKLTRTKISLPSIMLDRKGRVMYPIIERY